MDDARLTEVCDGLAAAIKVVWSPSGDDEVRRAYLTPVKADRIKGRKVLVFPVSYADEPATRGEQLTTYRVSMIVVERLAEAVDPASNEARDWLDERVAFVEQTVYGTVADYGADSETDFLRLTGHGPISTQAADVPVAYDPEMLVKKLFWCELEFEFREIN